MTKIILQDLPDSEDRFTLLECIGSGIFGRVRKAMDSAHCDRNVAIKIQKVSKENEQYITEELKVLKDFSSHPNLPEFYGAFKKDIDDGIEVWFAIELCEGGQILDLVNGLLEKHRRMVEEHIAFILKEVVKAVVYLHENHIMHRDIKASNILMTYEGEIKLVDFGYSRHLSSTLGKTDTSMGSPCWMAPEVVSAGADHSEDGYGSRADVWSVGITAIELGDGKTPFCGMHPTRALFQIVRNPPPTLLRPGNWSEMYNDFVSECLSKNPEHRPYAVELLEHPFLTGVPENNYYLTQELKALCLTILDEAKAFKHHEEFVKSSMLKTSIDEPAEKMVIEDLAALDHLTEEAILRELELRTQSGHFQTYVGDILLVLNPNENQDIYGLEYHKKYTGKSRSDNAPHIYSVADSAYQDALHHLIPQYIILAGESKSGKTTSYLHLMNHLLHLGENYNISIDRIKNGIKLIQAFTHAATPINDNSTRCVMKTDVIYGRSTKVSGCNFSVYQLEKFRVSSVEQPNFHIFYYFYAGLSDTNRLQKYHLESDYKYRYLRLDNKYQRKMAQSEKINRFKELEQVLVDYEFSEHQIETVYSILSAILLLGEIKFKELDNETAALENEELLFKIADLLKVEPQKLAWAMVNYCYVSKGTAVKRHHTVKEADNARDVLANVFYARLVDYIVNIINHKLSYGRTIFGEKYSIRILDMFGVESFKENTLSQVTVNTLNEQLHYLYLQRVFAWESLDMNEEGIPYDQIHYYDNKTTLEEILGKGGLLSIIDDTSKNDHGDKFVLDSLESMDNCNVKAINQEEFAIAHYTGKITYSVKGISKYNRDFLPPEIIDVLRASENSIIKVFFTNKLNKTGNITVSFDEKPVKGKVSSSSSDEENAYSQLRKMRTASSTFKALCLELMKDLAIGGGSGGTHFVRCIRSDLDGKANNFHAEIVKQQVRAMAVVETAKARQRGYPHRIIFSEFLRRYKFLAFGFDENVDTTRDNCRLLMVRLKMEGWVIGKTKVFLKYYNEEYLARMYENHIEKIVKIQCMMRSFLVKRKIAKTIQKDKERTVAELRRRSTMEMTQEQAAVVLQKAYRGLSVRRNYRPLVCKLTGVLDEETRDFIKPFANKWKNKSLFQVILQYRASKQHHLFNFAQQVHFFNQKCVHNLQLANKPIQADRIEPNAQESKWLTEMQPPVLKLPFRLDDIPYFDTTYMCDPLSNLIVTTDSGETWDTPFRWRDNVSSQICSSLMGHGVKDHEAEVLIKTNADKLINLPYNRDPKQPLRKLSCALLIEELLAKKIAHKKQGEDVAAKPPSPPVKASKPIETVKSKNETNIKERRPVVNPIAELQTLARRQSGSEDDAPFNFQGMLKKTNLKRESMKRAITKICESRRDSNEILGQMVKLKQTNLKKVNFEEKNAYERDVIEIAPGVILQGYVADL